MSTEITFISDSNNIFTFVAPDPADFATQFKNMDEALLAKKKRVFHEKEDIPLAKKIIEKNMRYIEEYSTTFNGWVIALDSTKKDRPKNYLIINTNSGKVIKIDASSSHALKNFFNKMVTDGARKQNFSPNELDRYLSDNLLGKDGGEAKLGIVLPIKLQTNDFATWYPENDNAFKGGRRKRRKSKRRKSKRRKSKKSKRRKRRRKSKNR